MPAAVRTQALTPWHLRVARATAGRPTQSRKPRALFARSASREHPGPPQRPMRPPVSTSAVARHAWPELRPRTAAVHAYPRCLGYEAAPQARSAPPVPRTRGRRRAAGSSTAAGTRPPGPDPGDGGSGCRGAPPMKAVGLLELAKHVGRVDREAPHVRHGIRTHDSHVQAFALARQRPVEARTGHDDRKSLCNFAHRAAALDDLSNSLVRHATNARSTCGVEVHCMQHYHDRSRDFDSTLLQGICRAPQHRAGPSIARRHSPSRPAAGRHRA